MGKWKKKLVRDPAVDRVAVVEYEKQYVTRKGIHFLFLFG